jgi:hypothetical protein
MGAECVGNLLVFVFIADDYGIGIEFDCLLYEQVGTVVGCEEFHLEKIAVLSDHIKGLSSDGTGGA